MLKFRLNQPTAHLIHFPRDSQDPAGSHDGEAKQPPSPPSFETHPLFRAGLGCGDPWLTLGNHRCRCKTCGNQARPS